MSKVNKKINKLKNKGYEIKNFIDIVNNDNFTNTICYTSKEFQPLVETFSDKFYFVGPSIRDNIVNSENENLSTDKKQIYISLGTVNNKNMSFYKNCINTFKNCDMNVIISVGDSTNIESFEEVPNNICIKNRVNQIEILQSTDVFITHCGMNSVSESLYYEVPMVLFPQQSE
jgi:MGT family glycosyltransferase